MDWSDEVQAIFSGDLTAAVAYPTPAGGAVVTAVSPVGIVDREHGTVGFTTSLGFGKKLERILRDPRVSLCYHSRTHGFSDSGLLVLAQGDATVSLTPAPERLVTLQRQTARHLGPQPKGRVWDWLLREYHQERVFIDVAVRRLTSWPATSGTGEAVVQGLDRPAPPDSQAPPKNGTGPRVESGQTYKRLAALPHQLLAYLAADGRPEIVPVSVTGAGQDGIRLAAAPGLLPPGARRAGLLGHSYNAQCVGLTVRSCTGWLETDGDEARYAPHTTQGFSVPASRLVQMVGNGVLAKRGVRKARSQGTIAALRRLAEETAH
jgi:hypothetical protein